VHIVIDTQPDPALHTAAFRYVLRRGTASIRFLGAVLTVVAVAVSLADACAHARFEMLAAPMLLVGLWLTFVVPSSTLRGVLRGLPETMRQPTHIELTEQSVRWSCPLCHAEYAWDAFQRAVELPGQVLLMLSPSAFLPVPTDSLDDAQREELGRFLADRQLVRA
jgi:hypothetical protein